MLLARLGAKGEERPVLLTEDRAYDLTELVGDLDPARMAAGFAEIEQAHRVGELPELDADGLRRGAPIASTPAVICIGQNYAAHAAESGAEPPKRPIIFLKTPNTLAGPDDEVAIPPEAEKVDWEVELGVVIGRPAYRLTSREQALEHVAGYLVVNDLSEREFQLEHSGGQWSKGKCLPGFLPAGPWLVTPDEIDPGNLRLRSRVNGDARQDSSTSDMIFDVADILIDLSQYMALEAGTIICTGTPQGVALSGRFPYLKPGDVAEIEIEGLGTQRHAFVALAGNPADTTTEGNAG